MGRPARERGPRWALIAQQIHDARKRLGLTQANLAAQVGCKAHIVSRDESGQAIDEDRLQAYSDFFRWDYDKILAFLTGAEEEPVAVRAQREYLDLFTLLDGHLKDGEEQDLVDEALQLVILHRYPQLTVSDFVPKV